MTTQEAQAWEARLTRIWEPNKIVRSEADDMLSWQAHLRRNIILNIYVDLDPTGGLNIGLGCLRGKRVVASLTLNEDVIKEFQERTQRKDIILREFIQRFLLQWRPLFRRNCWLSGADIEASSHEKAEWLHGFTPEEVEKWNLHF